MKQSRAETAHGEQRETARRPQRHCVAGALADPLRLDRVGFRITAHQGPEQAILSRRWNLALAEAALQGDPLQRRNRIAIGWKRGDLIDQAPRNTDSAGGGMVEVDPLEPRGQPLLDRLDQHALALRQKVDRFSSRTEQPISQRDQLVASVDQP